MPRNVVVLLNNPDGREMIKAACKEKGLLLAGFEELVQSEVDPNWQKNGVTDYETNSMTFSIASK
ncbi:MAG: hypothetical protein M2R45_02980 [Verrucomicrobia subdivision 3 bacterium]|nr:hypothetical protein [Limisphaerales bacterium]MCS1416533.1 hypothetical protein [Limisphaerales bacterium]